MKRTELTLTTVFLVILGSFSFVVSLIPSNASASTLYVGGMGPGNYTRIQDAIDDAGPGDTVYVYNGTYSENIILHESLSLIGEDRNTTIIDGRGILDAIHITADWANVTGFTVTNSGSFWPDAGISLNSVQMCFVANNIVFSNEYGIYLDFSDKNIIVNNIVSLSNWKAIALTDSDDNIIVNNIVSLSNWFGITLTDSDDNIVANNTISDNRVHGISLGQSYNITVVGNNISNSKVGIMLYYAGNSSISSNVMVKNGIQIRGDLLEHWNSHSIDTSSTIDGRPIYYWKNANGGTIPQNAGQVILANCSNVVVENQNITNASVGILLGFSSGNRVANNSVRNNTAGIFLYMSDDNLVTNNTAFDNSEGLHIDESSRCSVTNNTAFDNGEGIYVEESRDSNISNNTVYSNGNNGIILDISSDIIINNNIAFYNDGDGINLGLSAFNTIIDNKAYSNNEDGISLILSKRNTITGNIILSNRQYGISIYASHNNTIFHNNIIQNAQQAHDKPHDDTDINWWNINYPSGGNYWSDYTGVDDCSGPNQDVCPDPDGIGDTPYLIDVDIQDDYPLMVAHGGDTFPPYLSIVSPTEGQNFESPRINVTGTAFDVGGSGLQDVKVRLNGGFWSDAMGTSSWNTSFDLNSGPNLIEACAWDNSGNPSEISSVNVTFTPIPNRPPTAHFTLSPIGGNVSTIFTVNASSSSDYEDSVADLVVRWDWEDDGIWDTTWSTTKTAQHQYSTPGDYTVRLEVEDTGGLINYTARQVEVTALENRPPTCTINAPSPGSTLLSIYTISGTASDPDGAVEKVEIRINITSWIEVTGTTTWSYDWDTTAVPNGNYTIYARSYDGSNYSTVTNVTVIVDNPVPSSSQEPDQDWLWIAVVVTIALLIALLLVTFALLRKKKSKEEDQPETPSEEDSENRL